MKFLVKLLLSILSLRIFSRIWGRIARLRYPRFIVKRLVESYCQSYNINMDDYAGKLKDYKSLCDFFVRPLDPEKRPLIPDNNAIVSPADGILTNVETICNDQATQIKGKTYRISSLICDNIDFSLGWHVAVIYLAPFNYHRYHYPFTGNIKRYIHTGRRLFPVNPMGIHHIERLFIRNERIVTQFESKGLPCYAAAVGATFVGSIKMEFIEIRKKRHRWIPLDLEVNQLEEMGRFEMGSTIILVFPQKMAEPIPGVIGQPVKVGQPIFSFKINN
jgi:phosphatidylserine decarboxylase